MSDNLPCCYHAKRYDGVKHESVESKLIGVVVYAKECCD